MKTNDLTWSPLGHLDQRTITARGSVTVSIDDVTRFNPHDDVMSTHVLSPAGAKVMLAALREGRDTVEVTTVMTTERTASNPDGQKFFGRTVLIHLPSDEGCRGALENILLLASS